MKITVQRQRRGERGVEPGGRGRLHCLSRMIVGETSHLRHERQDRRREPEGERRRRSGSAHRSRRADIRSLVCEGQRSCDRLAWVGDLNSLFRGCMRVGTERGCVRSWGAVGLWVWKEEGQHNKEQTMPIIDGVGDELLYTALVAAPVVVVICRSSLGQSLSFLKQGVYFVRVWFGSLWGSVAMREEDGDDVGPPLHRTMSSSSFAAHMNSPPENDCCSVCHDSFTLPCQANCAHWFCGECILRVWQHSSVLQPCKCPICRRAITLLIPSEVSEARQQDSEVERIMRDLAKYNRIFGGGPVSFMQRVRDMPLLLRRMVGELMDPQRAIPLVHRTRILFFLVLLAVYVFSPLDVIPEGVLGLVGLLDDLLVIIMVLFYLAMLYRSTLILHHGGQPQ